MASPTCTCGYGVSCIFCTCGAEQNELQFNNLEISFIFPLFKILSECVQKKGISEIIARYLFSDISSISNILNERFTSIVKILLECVQKKGISEIITTYLFSDISSISNISNERFTSIFKMRVFNFQSITDMNKKVFQLINSDFPRVFNNEWIEKINSDLIFQQIFIRFLKRIFAENYYQQGIHAILHYLFQKYDLFTKNDIFTKTEDFKKILLELDISLSNFYKFLSLKESNSLLKRITGNEELSVYLLKVMTQEDDIYGHKKKIMSFLSTQASEETFKKFIQDLRSTAIRRMLLEDMGGVFKPFQQIKGGGEKKGILIPFIDRKNLSNKNFLDFLLDKLDENYYDPSYKIRIGWKIDKGLIRKLVQILNDKSQNLIIRLERRSFHRLWDSWALLVATQRK